MTGVLSAHLSVVEFCATAHRTWARANVEAWESQPLVRANAETRLAPLFEDVRTLLGVPLHVTSGFRVSGLNAAVGGRPASKHRLGLAIDVVPARIDVHAAFRIIVAAMRKGWLPSMDEAIIEAGIWLHVQAAAEGDTARLLALTSPDGKSYEVFTA